MIDKDTQIIRILAELEDFMFEWNAHDLPVEYVEEVRHYIRSRQRKAYGGLEQDFQRYLQSVKVDMVTNRKSQGSASGNNKRDQATRKV